MNFKSLGWARSAPGSVLLRRLIYSNPSHELLVCINRETGQLRCQCAHHSIEPRRLLTRLRAFHPHRVAPKRRILPEQAVYTVGLLSATQLARRMRLRRLRRRRCCRHHHHRCFRCRPATLPFAVLVVAGVVPPPLLSPFFSPPFSLPPFSSLLPLLPPQRPPFSSLQPTVSVATAADLAPPFFPPLPFSPPPPPPISSSTSGLARRQWR